LGGCPEQLAINIAEHNTGYKLAEQLAVDNDQQPEHYFTVDFRHAVNHARHDVITFKLKPVDHQPLEFTVRCAVDQSVRNSIHSRVKHHDDHDQQSDHDFELQRQPDH
jgi:hypothetical protein